MSSQPGVCGSQSRRLRDVQVLFNAWLGDAGGTGEPRAGDGIDEPREGLQLCTDSSLWIVFTLPLPRNASMMGGKDAAGLICLFQAF